MSKRHFLFRKFPIPKDSITLGSFVFNPVEPRQGFYDPCSDLAVSEVPKHDFSEITNPFRNQTSSRSLLLQAIISRFITGSLEGDWMQIDRIVASKTTEYTLLDSDGWFDTVCADQDVRIWMEKALMSKKKTLYMVTAYRTLSDAKVRSQKKDSVKIEAKGEAPISESQGDATGTMNVGGSVKGSQAKEDDLGMQVPDEKIYEIQYRKVELRGFIADSVDDAYLESGNRWVKLFTFRDGSGSIEEEDAVEASLGDDQDIPEGHHVIDDGDDQLVVPSVGS